MSYGFLYQKYGMTAREYSLKTARMYSKAKTILVDRYRAEHLTYYKNFIEESRKFSTRPPYSSAQARAKTRLVHEHLTEYRLIIDSLRPDYLGTPVS